MSAPVNRSGHPTAQLSAVHVCRSCGEGTERYRVSLESLINGLVRCRVCGYEGPLNIEILTQNGPMNGRDCAETGRTVASVPEPVFPNHGPEPWPTPRR